ncbi:sugar phosphate isomerase/epimerase family protein [Agreia sp. VKM Ac-1783]|uniref:sugar phosphate isomerase/epimerase family protein n=1 Tax=Agreia sp. VKM Ac-1783 TaxID=1938889 RepID=UPI000A2ABE57|nr:sugar phosphate isomerase/epimerase family protein [Agreia sp. VKM Ac-1783]SMQ59691.1 Sugar phosphate isomerase/epimerase [Agreia sp. VKM Ac-1783]
MSLSRNDWPIAASMLPFSDVAPSGVPVQDAGPEEWARVLGEVADAGFDCVDFTDNWVKVGDLSPARLDDLAAASAQAGLRPASVSAIRRSVIDAENGADNLAYSHRTLEAAARLGIEVVSFGLHQALTREQREQLWFWTVDGHRDDPDDVEAWMLAVARLRELGRHAEELGQLVSLELYEDTYLGTADSSVRLVEEIGLENVGLNPDIGNLIRLHRRVESWEEIVAKTVPYANFWHVKNYARDEDRAREQYFAVPAPMESGLINYRAAIASAIAAGFQGILCTENYGGDGLSVCAANRDYLRRHALPKSADYVPGRSRVRQGSLSVERSTP